MKKSIKKYVMPQTDVFTTLVEQSIMVLSTVKFHEVNSGGKKKDENGVDISDDPTDDDWDEIGWD